VTTTLPVNPREVLSVARELRSGAADTRPLAIYGQPGLVSVLRKDLARDGVASAVREGGEPESAVALVYVLAGEASAADVELLRRAERAGVPAVAVIAGPAGTEVPSPPYVLPTRVIRVPSGSGFPVDAIGRALAGALGDRGTTLAARLPALRGPVVDTMIERYARQNAALGTVGGFARATTPLLTMNQVRMFLRIGDAYGFEIDRDRIPEVIGVIAGGLGFRRIARSLIGYVPVAGWLVRGGVAYGGTRAVGEAAKRYFERRAPVTRIDRDRELFPR
jgi:uncharacterized protein (DUF697 family)